MNVQPFRSENRHFVFFLIPWLLLTGFKFWYASVSDLFGDEAFYWWESVHLAWSYSDLPPMTAWMIALSEWLFGHSIAGIRTLTILASASIPLLVVWLARLYLNGGLAWLAGLISLSIPLLGTMGLYALPDVWINLFWVALLISLTKAIRGHAVAWLLAGLFISLGLLTHLRFGVLLLATALLFLLDPQLRHWMRRPLPWAALLLGMTGLLPLLLFDLDNGFANTGFQLIERHPWTFQSQGLVQPLIQMMVVTPLLYILLLIAAITGYRKAEQRLLMWAGLLPLLTYWLVGLWADQHRTDFHWPLAAYLPLSVMLAGMVRNSQTDGQSAGMDRAIRIAVPVAIAMALLVTLALSFQLSRIQLNQEAWLKSRKYLPENLIGWSSFVEDLKTEIDALTFSDESTAWIIMDNFMPAAQWAFHQGEDKLVVLDHPINSKHGRQVQLELWSLGASSLPDGDWRGILVTEPLATAFRDRAGRFDALCDQFDLSWITELTYLNGDKRFQLFSVSPPGNGRCDRPAFGYLDQPLDGDLVSQTVRLSGWAVSEHSPIRRIAVTVDGVPAGELDYGQEHLGVKRVFPDVSDPNEPFFGFSGNIDLSTMTPGESQLEVMIETWDGASVLLDSVTLSLTGSANSTPAAD